MPPRSGSACAAVAGLAAAHPRHAIGGAVRIRGHSAGRLSGSSTIPWRTRHDSIV